MLYAPFSTLAGRPLKADKMRCLTKAMEKKGFSIPEKRENAGRALKWNFERRWIEFVFVIFLLVSNLSRDACWLKALCLEIKTSAARPSRHEMSFGCYFAPCPLPLFNFAC